MTAPGHNGPTSAEILRHTIDRWESLESKIKDLKDQQKETLAAAKSQGLDTKSIRACIKLRAAEEKYGRAACAMQESVTDTYRAHLGLLWDTPLGAAAAQRMTSPLPDPAAQRPVTPEADPAPDLTPEQARAAGHAAALSGQPLNDNPCPPRSAARAAWDEGWCSALGTTGMDIPDALRPPAKPTAQPADAHTAPTAPSPAAAQPAATPEQARAQGAEAARNGILLTANPYPARSAARAAWDEGWCSETGTTGADIPPDLTPPPAEPEAES